jgi:2-polyprenyl-3-methyl-5-hydroxy-6-metoxy-1,4-benzoquinol methylase
MAEKHYCEQQNHTRGYLIPYFDEHLPDWRNCRILEVGCAEGGFLDVLEAAGIHAAGIELMQDRVERAHTLNPKLNVRVGDITDPVLRNQFDDGFDLIILRDVIEHIPNREATFQNLEKLLNPDGCVYITFPPRFSPFGGHHQNGRSALKRMPWLHLLPAWKVRMLGRWFRENEHIIEGAIHNFRNGLSVRRFIRLYKMYGFEPAVNELFLSRPIYKTRFGWKTIRFPNIPFFREFLATGCEVILKKSRVPSLQSAVT